MPWRRSLPTQEKIEIENINCPGQTPNVDATKYKAMKKVLLKLLPKRAPGLTQSEMQKAILPHLPQRPLARWGEVGVVGEDRPA